MVKENGKYWMILLFTLFCVITMKCSIVQAKAEGSTDGVLFYQKLMPHKNAEQRAHPNYNNDDIINMLAEKITDDGNHQYFTLQKITNFLFIFLRIIVILSLAIFVRKFINRTTKQVIKAVAEKHQKNKKNNKYYNNQLIVETATPIVLSILHWGLSIVSILLILATIGIDIMPIIYSFGVVGLAISIGSQALVKDLINGVLTLFEGNIAVGETATINGNLGIIEGISLRCIEFRHSSGPMQVIPFSEISILQNLSRDYSVAKIQFAVAHGADINVVENALRSVYKDMQQSPEFSKMIKEDIQFKGIDHFSEIAVYVLAVIKLYPDPFQNFTHEFNRLLHIKLKELQVPFPLILPFVIK